MQSRIGPSQKSTPKPASDEKGAKRRPSRNPIYAVPLVLFITGLNLTLGIATHPPIASEDTLSTITENEVTPMLLMFRGAAYVLALVLFFRHISGNAVLLLRTWPYFLILLLIIASLAWTAYPQKLIINFGHAVGMVLVAISTMRYFQDHPEDLFVWLTTLLSYPVVLSLIAGLAFPSVSIDYSGNWFGIFANYNNLGQFCMMLAWASASVICVKRGSLIKLFGGTNLFFALCVLWLAGSRTSQIATVLLVAIFSFAVYTDERNISVLVLRTFFAFFLGSTVILSVLVMNPELLTWEGVLRAMGRAPSLTGRDKLWAEGERLISQRPWLGWSFDSNMSALGRQSATGAPIYGGQFHNGYIDLMVRGGWIGLSLFAILIAQLFFFAAGQLGGQYRITACYLALVIAFLIHNIAEASAVRDSSTLWLLVLIVYITIMSRDGASKR